MIQYLVLASFSIMLLISSLGDLQLSGALYLHMIPEIIGLFFLGAWIRQRGHSYMIIVGLALLTVIVAAITVGHPLAALLIGGPLVSVALIGYWTQHNMEHTKNA